MRGLKNVKDHNKKSGADKKSHNKKSGADIKSHPYEEELEFMSTKPSIQPECGIGTKSKKETKLSSEESEAGMPHAPTSIVRENVRPLKSCHRVQTGISVKLMDAPQIVSYQ
jgi:hypothetical protein